MYNPQLTHHIQLSILRRMLGKSEVRYSELKPKELEANLFMYHLKQLIKANMIEKQDKTYVLTREGKSFADRVTLDNMRTRIQPKVITILTVKRDDGQWLMLTRKHQPFLNYKGFPSGKVHYGESLQQAATRELYETSGLSDVALTLRGNIIMRFSDSETHEPVNHVIGYIFYGEIPASVHVDFDHEHFRCDIVPESEFYKEPCFKGHEQILGYLKRGDTCFIEEVAFESDY